MRQLATINEWAGIPPVWARERHPLSSGPTRSRAARIGSGVLPTGDPSSNNRGSSSSTFCMHGLATMNSVSLLSVPIPVPGLPAAWPRTTQSKLRTLSQGVIQQYLSKGCQYNAVKLRVGGNESNL